MDDEKLQEIIKDIRSLARRVDNYETAPKMVPTNQKYRRSWRAWPIGSMPSGSRKRKTEADDYAMTDRI